MDSKDTLQLALSEAVDKARAIDPGQVDTNYLLLCQQYTDQIIEALTIRLPPKF